MKTQVGALQEQMKSQLDSLEILVEAKSSLEKNLDQHKKLLQEKDGKVYFQFDSSKGWLIKTKDYTLM